jgi:O-acetyl-ADP-ribose deacetylase (regulator of RNase III)
MLRDAGRDQRREPITRPTKYPYRLKDRPQRRVNILTGDLRDWRGIDVWVNSENTNLQMARFYDRSLSAMIRYESAVKDDNDQVLTDTVANELTDVLGARTTVTAGTVHVTGSGALAESHGVKHIFHAATTHGSPGSGYQVIPNVERCVTAALKRMDHPRFTDEGLRTIVFPMMGTGEGGGDVLAVAPKLILAAVAHFLADSSTAVTEVSFVAWNHRDLEACLAACDTVPELVSSDE